MKAVFGTRGSIVGQGIVGLPKVQIPYARDVLGSWAPLISRLTPLVYFAFFAGADPRDLLPPLAARPAHPRRRREAGGRGGARHLDHPRALLPPSLLCGLFAGLAGAHLSLGYITMFTENMSSGRGFTAVAILIFSAGDPIRVLLGCLLFGFCRRLLAAPADLRLPILPDPRHALCRGAVGAFLPVLPRPAETHPRDRRDDAPVPQRGTGQAFQPPPQ